MLTMIQYLGGGLVAAAIIMACGGALVLFAAVVIAVVEKAGFVAAIFILFGVGWALLATAEHFQKPTIG